MLACRLRKLITEHSKLVRYLFFFLFFFLQYYLRVEIRSNCMSVRNRSIQTGQVNGGWEKNEHRITPSPPPLVFVMAKGLCVFLLACERERNNAVPHRRHTTLMVGLKTTFEKRRGRVVFMSLTSLWVPFLQTVCGMNLWRTQTHNSFVLRHYNTPAAEGRHRRLEKKKEGGGWNRLNRGTFSAWGGMTMEEGIEERCGPTHSLNNTKDTAAPPKV